MVHPNSMFSVRLTKLKLGPCPAKTEYPIYSKM